MKKIGIILIISISITSCSTTKHSVKKDNSNKSTQEWGCMDNPILHSVGVPLENNHITEQNDRQ